MSVEEVKEGLKIYNEYLNNSSSVSKEELEVIKNLINYSKEDLDFNSFFKEFCNISDYNERLSKIQQFSLDDKKEIDEEEELISSVFGVDISEIEHKSLESGIDVFAFYDSKYQRKRVLENPKEKETLVEQLKSFQNDNEDFQTVDYKENSNDILKYQANNLDIELQMIHITDINNYRVLIDGLEEEKRNSLIALLARKDELDISYVNIDNALALDSDGNMIEGFIDEKTKQAKVEKPKEYSYNNDEISNEDKIDEFYQSNAGKENKENNENEDNDLADNNIDYNDFEDIPELIEAELIEDNVNYNRDVINNIKNNIIKYYNNPDLMINLNENEMEFYEKFVNIYAQKIEERKTRNKNNEMGLKPDNNSTSGFFNIILLSIFIIVVAIMIIIILD